MRVGGQRHAPAAVHPGKTRYPLNMSLGGSQGRSEREREISPQPGFDPRTVQPVASRYTDWAIPVPSIMYGLKFITYAVRMMIRQELRMAEYEKQIIHCPLFMHTMFNSTSLQSTDSKLWPSTSV
jgi:hypothetical protein